VRLSGSFVTFMDTFTSIIVFSPTPAILIYY
jgi:hypothetical protein